MRKITIGMAMILLMLLQTIPLSSSQSADEESDNDRIHADAEEKVIVLLAKTADYDPKPEHTQQFYENMLFGTEFGQMAHFYLENSLEKTRITGEVIDWTRLDGDLSDYDDNLTTDGDEYGVGVGIEEIVDLVDDDVDFSIYDQDGDGSVDNFMIIWVGEDDAANGDSNGDGDDNDPDAQWPIMWGLQTDHETDDGVHIGGFFTCSEECDMGTFAHEFGHNLGVHDLYDSDYSSEGVGFWSVMGAGNQVLDGETPNPTHFDAWSKYRLGWTEPTIVSQDSSSQSFTLRPAETTGDSLLLPIADDEFYMLEYRSRSAGEYDRGMPASGVLIWHVDESIKDEYGDYDNSDEDHPTISLIQADGRKDLENSRNGMDEGDLFTAGDVFNNRSSPPSSTHAGDESGWTLSFTNPEDGSDSMVVNIGGESSGSAWFESVEWNWLDSDDDNFLDAFQMNYTFTADTDDIDLSVQINMTDVLDIYGETIIWDIDHDLPEDLEYIHQFQFNLENDSMALCEFKVDLLVDGVIADTWEPEHAVWLETPSQWNEYDEWFHHLELVPFDGDSDGLDDTISGSFTVYSDESEYMYVGVSVFVVNTADGSETLIHEVANARADGTQYSFGIDLKTKVQRPGMFDVVVRLNETDRGQLEEIFIARGFDMWWNDVWYDKMELKIADTDADGMNDTTSISLRLEHTFRETTDVEVLIELRNSEYDLVDSESFELKLGMVSPKSSGGRELIETEFRVEAEDNFTIRVYVKGTDGRTLALESLPEWGPFHMGPPAPVDEPEEVEDEDEEGWLPGFTLPATVCALLFSSMFINRRRDP